MDLLILGGTVFLGRHLVEAALAAGHRVTLFNRGQHGAGLFPHVEKLRGDRNEGLDALIGRRWDAAIDTCGYVPRLVRASAELLAKSVDHYTFISSISVYRDLDKMPVDENSPVGTLDDESMEEITGETYGPLKALCEQAAESAMPGRVLNVRPGLIVGPHDPSDRFTYWVWRATQAGAVLAPGRPQRRIEIIDGRDLAHWILHMIEARRTGVFNASGPDYALTMGDLLTTCQQAAGGAHLTWVSEAFLLANDVAPWSELPLWLPEAENDVMAVDCRRALAAGLAFRPLAETVEDTLAWLQAERAASVDGDLSRLPLRAGMALAREAALLAAWAAHAESQR